MPLPKNTDIDKKYTLHNQFPISHKLKKIKNYEEIDISPWTPRDNRTINSPLVFDKGNNENF